VVLAAPVFDGDGDGDSDGDGDGDGDQVVLLSPGSSLASASA